MSELVHSERIADHDALHRALVERIVAGLRPVRRVWPVRVRLALWMLLEVLVLLLLIWHGYRPDVAEQLRDPWYLFGVGGFAVSGAIAAAFALRASIPGREPRTAAILVPVVLAGASALLLFHEPVDGHVQMAKFIGVGVPCAIYIALFASIPWVALMWAARRAAPLDAATEGGLTGAAAMFFSFALMRVDCPLDERLHLITWHLMPALIGIALSVCVGAAMLRRRVRD